MKAFFFYSMYKCQLLDYDCWVGGLSLVKFWGPGVVVRPICGQKEFGPTRSKLHMVGFGHEAESLLLLFLSCNTESYHISRVLTRPVK